MSEGSSGSKPDRQPDEAAKAARSSWFSDALGEGWVEVEPGIYRQREPDHLAGPTTPGADVQATSIDQALRDAVDALSVDKSGTETPAGETSRSNRPHS